MQDALRSYIEEGQDAIDETDATRMRKLSEELGGFLIRGDHDL